MMCEISFVSFRLTNEYKKSSLLSEWVHLKQFLRFLKFYSSFDNFFSQHPQFILSFCHSLHYVTLKCYTPLCYTQIFHYSTATTTNTNKPVATTKAPIFRYTERYYGNTGSSKRDCPLAGVSVKPHASTRDNLMTSRSHFTPNRKVASRGGFTGARASFSGARGGARRTNSAPSYSHPPHLTHRRCYNSTSRCTLRVNYWHYHYTYIRITWRRVSLAL